MADTEKKAQQEATAEKKAKKASAKTDSKKSGGKGKKDAEKKQNIFARIAGWFKDLKKEFKKVVWPDRKKVQQHTGCSLCCCYRFCCGRTAGQRICASDEVLDRSFQVNREQNRRIDYVRGSKMVCDSHLFRL